MRIRKILVLGMITGLLVSNIVGMYHYIEQGKENTELKSGIEGYRLEGNRLNKHNQQLTQYVNKSTAEIERLEIKIKDNKATINELRKELKIKE